MPVTRAVILARGLGTRMRRADAGARLEAGQAAAADVGCKAMIPVGGRPFLDFLLSALADAGVRDVCLVVGPEHTPVRVHYERVRPERLRIHFAVQPEARGTADALLAAETFIGAEPFLALNADNYYPAEVLAALSRQPAPALPAFAPAALREQGNIPVERIASFALLELAADGRVRRIHEKPDAETLARLGPDAPVSMNVWLLTPDVLRACREVPRSAGGEFVLPVAVQYGIDHLGLHVHAFPVQAGVLDLSQRADVAAVAHRLAGLVPSP
jgi:glucose-1-phosphate thymidylyltransferase